MSETQKKNITVELYGKTFQVRSDDEEYLQEVASRIDSMMNTIGQGKRPFELTLVLAALTMGDELTKAEKTIEEFCQKQSRLIDSIDEIIDENSSSSRICDYTESDQESDHECDDDSDICESEPKSGDDG